MAFPTRILRWIASSGTPDVKDVRKVTLGTGLSLTDSGNGAVVLNTSVGMNTGDIVATLVNTEVAVTTTATLTISKYHVCTGTSADYTVTLPSASGNAGKLLGVRVSPAMTKLLTVDAGSGVTIDGVRTRIMWAGESAVLLCDGTNWFKVAGKTIPMTCKAFPASTQTFSNATYTKITLTVTDIDNTGTMNDTTNSRIYCRRSGTYTATQYYTGFTGAAGTSIVRLGYGLNGTTTSALTAGGLSDTGGNGTMSGVAVVTMAAGDYMTLVVYQSGSGNVQANNDTTAPVLRSFLSLVESPSW